MHFPYCAYVTTAFLVKAIPTYNFLNNSKKNMLVHTLFLTQAFKAIFNRIENVITIESR